MDAAIIGFGGFVVFITLLFMSVGGFFISLHGWKVKRPDWILLGTISCASGVSGIYTLFIAS